MTTRGRSFRTRLTLTFVAVFLVAGTALLTVGYVTVGQLFDTAGSAITVSVDDAGGVVVEHHDGWPSQEPLDDVVVTEITSGEVTTATVSTTVRSVEGVVERTQAVVRDDVMTGLLGWSAVTLVVFAVVAAFVASWLARASLGRIAEITATTRTIGGRRLDARLDLPGPSDEIKELGDTIDGMLDRLEDAFTRQREFVANASHELRTPLATARTALEVPLEQGRIPDDLRLAVDRALAANHRSEALTSALLALASVDAASGGADVTDVEVVPLVDATIATFHDEIVRRDLTVDVEAPDRAVAVRGNPVLLERLVHNLVENAVVHNVDGGTVHVRVTGDGRDGPGGTGRSLEVVVDNTGPMLAPEAVGQLTRPFHRGGHTRLASGAVPGHGIGLAVVQRVVGHHGGGLELAARPDGGLRARVHLDGRGAPLGASVGGDGSDDAEVTGHTNRAR